MKHKYLTRGCSALLAAVMGAVVLTANAIPAQAICCRKDGFDKTRYTLTGNMAKDVAIIAKSQNGRTGAQFGYSGVDANGWCDEFVADCIELAGAGSDIVAHGGDVNDFRKVMEKRGMVRSTTPQAGDLVFYYRESTKSYVHVGIMLDSTSSAHGNISGKVYVMSYKSYGDGQNHSVGNGLTAVFMRPAYTGTTVSAVFHRNLNSDDTKTVKETFTTGVNNQKFGYKTDGTGRYSTMNAASVGFGAWTKPGHDMLGWSKDKNATERSWDTYANVIDSWIARNAPTIDLYAVWKPHVYTVCFEADGDYGTKEVTYGTAYGDLPVPEAEGCRFGGWFTADDEEITADSVYSATTDQVLYAHWIAAAPSGDCTGDGKFDVLDVVALQKWLLAREDSGLTDWQAADLCQDDALDVFDLGMMKHMLYTKEDLHEIT